MIKGTKSRKTRGRRRGSGRRVSNTIINALLLTGSVIFILVATIVADRLLGLAQGPDVLAEGLVFRPHRTATYETIEFACTVETNNIGIRDYELDVGARAATRVVVLGDSFTYGWGVNLEDTWVKRLEARFREEGRDIEILNLGRPGACPKDYAILAEKAVPVLKPDLVLVAALQMDDINQCVESNVGSDELAAEQIARAEWGRMARPVSAIARGMGFLYPNFTRRFASKGSEGEANSAQAQRSVDMNDLWRRQAADFFRELRGPAKERFEALEPHIQQAFRDVKLNPYLMMGFFLEPEEGPPLYLNPHSEEMQARIGRCGEYLNHVRQIAEAQGAACAVVAIPFPSMVSKENLKAQIELGGHRDEQELTSSAADEGLAQACALAGLPFYTVTEAFREKAPAGSFYFKYDGHFTAAGHAFFAECAAPILEQILTGI